MNKINLPGFTAEASLGRVTGSMRMAHTNLPLDDSTIFPALPPSDAHFQQCMSRCKTDYIPARINCEWEDASRRKQCIDEVNAAYFACLSDCLIDAYGF